MWKAYEALLRLREEGIKAELVNVHTVKPLDEEAVLRSARKTGCVVTAEEHQMNGGLSESIARLLAQKQPLPMEIVAVNDLFGQSGTPDELLDEYGLGVDDIVKAAKRALNRKA